MKDGGGTKARVAGTLIRSRTAGPARTASEKFRCGETLVAGSLGRTALVPEGTGMGRGERCSCPSLALFRLARQSTLGMGTKRSPRAE